LKFTQRPPGGKAPSDGASGGRFFTPSKEIEMNHSQRICSLRALLGTAGLAFLLSVLGSSAVSAEEGRCVWFHRWEWSDRQDIANTISNIDACHCNAVLFQVRGQGDAFYIPEHEPWSTLVGADYPGYDPLAVAIYEAHSRGLELHAYVNAMPAWSGSTPHPSPDHIYNAHPEWIMVDTAGIPMDPAGGYADISPGIPQAVEHLNDVIMDIATKYDVDGIHLDYIRYPGWDDLEHDYSYDDSSLARFARDYPGCTPATCEGEWDQFRRTLITEVVRAAHDSVTALKPWVKISAATWGVFIYGYNGYFQDSHGWLEEGILDFHAPMIYTAACSTFGSRLHDHAVNKYGRHVYAGIGVYYQNMTPEIMVAEIDTCRSQGVEGQTFFASGNLTSEYRNALIGVGGPYQYPDDMPAMAWKDDKPFTVSVALPISGEYVDVLFSRDVDPVSGQNAANYTFAGGLAALSATRDVSDHRLVHLTTTPQELNTLYTLMVSNVADESAKETVVWPNNQRQFYGLYGSGIEIIVDNEDGAPGFTTVGSGWGTSEYGNCWNDNKHYHSRDTIEVGSATWMTPISIPGEYDVYFWVNDENYAEDAHYYIDTHAGTDSAIGDQRYVDPEGWQPLGTFPFSDTARVSVTTYWKGAGIYVIADAIRWVFSGPLEPDAPPAAVIDLASTKSADDIALTWSAVTQDTAGNPLTVDRYVVYRDDEPLTVPSDSIGFTAGTEYADPGAAGAPAANYYYVVRAVSDAKGKSAASNTVGEFDIDLGNAKKAAGGKQSAAHR
jgi:uncharacterized lipoprotein YddW (UPF0748 family)